MKKNKKNWIKLLLLYNIINLTFTFLFFPLVTQILSYPPNSINNILQIDINGLTYNQQYLIIIILSLFIENLFLFFFIKTINKLQDNISKINNSDVTNLYYELAKKVFNIPLKIYLIQVLIPTIAIAVTFSSLNGDILITLKVCAVFFSIFTLIASVAYIFSKKILNNILITIFYEATKTNILDTNFKKYLKRSTIMNSVFMVAIPMSIVTSLFVSLIAYSTLINEKGDLTYQIYEQHLSQMDSSYYGSNNQIINILENTLSKIDVVTPNDTYFILTPDNNSITSDNKNLSEFFIKYIKYISIDINHNNRTYDFYGQDYQGVFKIINVNNVNWIIGFRYCLSSGNMALSSCITVISLLLLNIILLTYCSKFISFDINRVSNALDKISNLKNDDYLNYKLPITSNNEIGDLVQSFGKIQILNKNYISKIHDSQDKLMEKERLASLGQLIGGIAHNLKTPIMSISGAAEGLKDLVNEYDSSIEDSEVTFNDHHEIAKDMQKWISKIKEYDEYMSDVITVVKGQAVTLSEDQEINFTIEELVKRVNILMKHELKNALIDMNVNTFDNNELEIHGNINSLVQVINNLISNSIQAYNGQTNKKIDLLVKTQDTHLIISVTDYGSGISKEVQDKLFKEMITTKGKNGTGLGLFMSYSTIRAHFNGKMTVESELNKGTTFNIILPIANK